MQYFTPDHPNALPLWHHGRMFLSPTVHWASIQTQANQTYQVPLCTQTEAAVLVDAAREALPHWVGLSCDEKQALFFDFAQELKQYQTHLETLLPADFPAPNWIKLTAFLENAVHFPAENGQEEQVWALLPGRNVDAFFQFWKRAFWANQALIIKPQLEFSAFFLALAELANRFPADFFQVLLGTDEALQGLDSTAIDAFVVLDSDLQQRLAKHAFQKTVCGYEAL